MNEQPTILTVPVFSDLGLLAMALRREVFVAEQGYAEADEIDQIDYSTATHVVAVVAGSVVGTLRIIYLPEHVKIGRVAVRRDLRGRGVAGAMMRFAMDLARERGETRFWLSAQSDKTGFYERFGFTAYGDEYLDDGQPHMAMRTY
jgi:predicted GNAT family N-acyltransferase